MVTDVPVMICGAVADLTTPVISAAVAMTSESPVVPMSMSMPGRSHLRTIASYPRPPDAAGSRLTVVLAPPVVHCAIRPSPLLASMRLRSLDMSEIAPWISKSLASMIDVSPPVACTSAPVSSWICFQRYAIVYSAWSVSC